MGNHYALSSIVSNIIILYALGLGQERKMLCCPQRPISKIELNKLGLGMHPTFVRLGVFFTVFERERKKKVKMHLNFVLLGAWKKLIKKEKKIPTNQPKYS